MLEGEEGEEINRKFLTMKFMVNSDVKNTKKAHSQWSEYMVCTCTHK